MFYIYIYIYIYLKLLDAALTYKQSIGAEISSGRSGSNSQTNKPLVAVPSIPRWMKGKVETNSGNNDPNSMKRRLI
jgi:hypothetical protein